MASESRLALNPRVSVFRHKGGVYLFDPATRTCASINEAMLAFITEPGNAGSLDGLCDNDHKELTGIITQLRRLGVLLEPETVDKSKRAAVPDHPAAMTHLAIFVTTKCNLRCAYCYAQGGDTERTINKDTWRPVMVHFFASLIASGAQEKANRKSVNLAIHGGGEATVEFASLKDIVTEFYGRARAAGLQPSVGMGTNGTYHDAVHRWIIENNIGVYISLDGPRAIQNRLRPFRSGQPSYDLVARNLQGLVKAGRRVSVRATITDESVETMEETIEVAKQLGLAAVHFEPVTLTGRCSTTALAKPDADQFAQNFLRSFLLGLKLDVNVRYSGMRCFEHHYPQFCAACGQNFCVTPDGNITTCYEVLNSTDPAASLFFIGKVDPVQGRVALAQERIEQLQQRVAENMEACRDCFLRYNCAGDCPLKSFRYSHRDLYSPDPYRCRIAQRINRQLIAWLADGVIEPRDATQTRVISFNKGLT